MSKLRKVISILAHCFYGCGGRNWACTSEFQMFCTLGFSLVASAGVMNIIVAVAARPVLGI